MQKLNDTQRAILGSLFEVYPNKIKSKDLESKFQKYPDLKPELEYLRERKLVEAYYISPDSKAKKVLWLMTSDDPDRREGAPAFTDFAYRIHVDGIDVLKASLGKRGKGGLTRTQVKKAIPHPEPFEGKCNHKFKELIEINEGSKTSVSGGMPVIKGTTVRFGFVAFYRCKKCNEVFYKEVPKLE